MNIFKRIIYVHKINKGLGIKLYRWQKRYIFGRSNFIPAGRGNGKTLAHILRTCLSRGPVIFLGDYSFSSDLTDYFAAGLSEERVPYKKYCRWYETEFYNVYSCLKSKTNLKLREVRLRR